ncbi:MAG: mechanosensitive ion channel [Clostridia bacterium]|nr:mechanosensitive ion channel [Clostridia bacterium]
MRELFNKLESPWNYVAMIATAAVILLICFVVVKINKRVFKRFKKNKNQIHLVFFEKLNTIIIIIAGLVLIVSVVFGANSIWNTVLGGTAILSAVLAFAAQDVLRDILAGLMISLYKPFEIGDRIELDDSSFGIVEDITMRHVVLIQIDTLRIVVPNSKLNTMKITNMSVGAFDRSVHFRFSVSYDTDVELAKRVTFDAIKESEYSMPVSKKKGAEPDYSPVYFLKFSDSALILAVTVYYEKCFPTEVVINDINTRVRKALIENNIEIPYNYITVVNKSDRK